MTEPAATPGVPRPEETDGQWLRVHPLTPYVRSWLLIVALVWGTANVFLDDVISAVVSGEPLDVDVTGPVQAMGAGVAVAVLCGVVGVMIGLGVLSWWFTRYQVTPEHVRFRSGMVFRTQRQARLDRVQGIDVERKFLPRLLGLASLKFDVADGGSSALELSYLGRDEARELRQQLLVAARAAIREEPRPAPWDNSPQARRARADIGSGLAHEQRSREIRVADRLGLLTDGTDQDQGRRVFTVPTTQVVLSMLLSGGAVFGVVMAVVAVVVAVREPDSLRFLLPACIPGLVGVASGLYKQLERGWGFTLSEVQEGVRIRYGLLNERSSTIPAGRVQALQVSEPALWRVFGGHRVRVTTAGKGGGGDLADFETLVLPVGSAENVEQILRLVLPLTEPPTELVRSGLTGMGQGQGYVTSPRRARWLDPITWRRTGFAMDESVLALRWGRLSRHVSVIPHHKTQSFGWEQGPLERRMNLAGVHVHMILGAVTTRLYHLDADDVSRLQVRQTAAARSARDLADRWAGSAVAGSVHTAARPTNHIDTQEDAS